MTSIPQVATAMQRVLDKVAEEAAERTQFVQRASKLTGAKFTQTVVFGWLSNGEATLEQLAQTAAAVGVSITPQGLDHRLTKAGADCLEQVLNAAVTEMITTDPVAIPILERFNGVYIHDSSVITLPDELAERWRGCGGRCGAGQSAVKLQVGLELSRGELTGPYLQAGRVQDRSSKLQSAPLPKGSLLIRDLGYWSIKEIQARHEEGGFWLSRIMTGTVVYDLAGKRWKLLAFLRALGADQVDVPVKLGRQQLPARLLALRVPQEVAERRRRQIREAARSKGQTPSKEALALADWFILGTNAHETLLSLQEALVLARARWQIELLFKLWKSHGRVNAWRSKKPWRILCEVYGKLLGMIVQHWMLVINCWKYPNRSLWKAAQTVRRYTIHLAAVFHSHEMLCDALAVVRRCLATGCRINTRRAKPNTYQLLLDPSLLCWQGLT